MIEIKSYKTIDGKVFDNRDKAIEHEKTLMHGVKVFEVYAYPDTTEGRHGPQFQGYLLVHANDYQEKFAEHWGFKKYGNKINFVMGVYGSNAIIDNWYVRPSKKSVVELVDGDKILDRIEENFVSKKLFNGGVKNA